MQAANANYLLRAVKSGRAPHAVLISGAGERERIALAKQACALCCTKEESVQALTNCPDYFSLGPGSVGVDDVRALQAKLAAKSFSGKRAVALYEAHQMTEQAQNALLKTLEEPPEHTMLLLTGNEAGLLPTICSRCSNVRLGAMPTQQIVRALSDEGVNADDAALCGALACGVYSIAQQMSSPAYQALRQKSCNILFTVLLTPQIPFADMTALLNEDCTPLFPDAEQPLRPNEQKKQLALICLEVFLSVLCDMLLGAVQAANPRNSDLGNKLARATARFTSRQIQAMITIVFSTHKRLRQANPALTMDQLLISLSEVTQQRRTAQ